jgi:hypothetical protein
MMKKTLFFATTLFVLYAFIMPCVAPFLHASWLRPSNMFQANVISQQQYVYERNDSEVVIVGSSLASVLSPQHLPDTCFNLALRGYSLYDGLEIIRRSGAKPKLVLIETNWLDRYPAGDVNGHLFLPGMYSLRKYLTTLRDGYRPLDMIMRPLALNLFRFVTGKPTVWLRTPSSGDPSLPGRQRMSDPEEDPPQRQILRGKIIAVGLELYNHAYPERILNELVAKLKTYLQNLEANKTRVVFFEMPMDMAWYNSDKLRTIRDALARDFPPGRYDYLPSPDWKDFITTDGLHLDRESAEEYTLYLNAKLQELLHRPAERPNKKGASS